jgi:hypothetical protein
LSNHRVIVAWGDGQFPSAPGNASAPSCSIFRKLKQVSRMLGFFPNGHKHAGQQRLTVLKVNEDYSSQMPSCWASGFTGHPALPIGLPPLEHRLSTLNNIWAVKQCPHCEKVWNRDVNACRYDICFYL